MMKLKSYSTISCVNSDSLNELLDDLLNDGYLSFYCFITHVAARDHSIFHHHVLLFPSSDDKISYLKELFGDLYLHRFGDWYGHCLHKNPYWISYPPYSSDGALESQLIISNLGDIRENI